jgi:hypothetical protein
MMPDKPYVTLFSSCRLLPFHNLFSCSDINELTTYTHSTKEVIQLLKFIRKELDIPEHISKYLFRNGIFKGVDVTITDNIVEKFNRTNLFIIEICTSKKYTYQGYYLHHLIIDSRTGYYPLSDSHDWQSRRNDVKIEYQTKDEISNDIDEIRRLIGGRDLIVVTHILPYSPTIDLKRRGELINNLGDICLQKNIKIIFPTEIFENIDKDKHFELIDEDLGHYTPLGWQEIGKLYCKKMVEFGYL